MTAEVSHDEWTLKCNSGGMLLLDFFSADKQDAFWLRDDSPPNQDCCSFLEVCLFFVELKDSKWGGGILKVM